MKSKVYCRKWSIPLSDGELIGTENIESASSANCLHCEVPRAFKHREAVLHEMEDSERKMTGIHLPGHLIEMSFSVAPSLKRWKSHAGFPS